MTAYDKLLSLRNDTLYWIAHSSGVGTRHNMPFTIGCDIDCEYGRCKFISYFDVKDDTNQDSVYVLTAKEEVKTTNAWSLNYNKNLGLPVSLSDVLRLLNNGESIDTDGFITDSSGNFVVEIGLSVPLSAQPGVCEKIIELLLRNKN